MAGVHRLFFALCPDEAVRRAIADLARPVVPRTTRGRMVRPERLHMTLQFLGDFGAPSRVVEHAVAAAGSLDPPQAFELTLDRLGSFGRGRVAWLGTAVPAPELLQLHRRLGDALEAQDLRPDPADAFVPHVTLARNTGAAVEGAVPALRWLVREFVLVDSNAGAYEVLGRWPLPDQRFSRECRSPVVR